MKSKFHFLFLILLLATILPCCKKSNDPSTPPPIKNKLAYIYKSDSADGVAFKNLFKVNGCAVTLINKPDAASFDYSTYNMIIIGGNTSTLGGADKWSITTATLIKNTGKPLMFLGEGGYLFADSLNNIVSWKSSASNNLTSFIVTDPASPVYSQPKHITVPASNELAIYTSNTKVLSFYAASIPVANVALIGQETGSTNTKYYSITFEQNKYGEFGFYAEAKTLTPTGQDFFVNLVYYVGGLTL